MHESSDEKIEKEASPLPEEKHKDQLEDSGTEDTTLSDHAETEPRVSEPMHIDQENVERSHPESENVGERTQTPQKKKTGSIKVSYVSRTDVGLIRDHNEDNFLIADYGANLFRTGDKKSIVEGKSEIKNEPLVVSVCDGMGGAAAGEVASKIAVDTIEEIFTDQEYFSEYSSEEEEEILAKKVVESIQIAGQRIFETAQNDRSRHGMGTTATVAAVADQTLFVGQVGDSRAYILRKSELAQITKDQSLVNQLIEAGQLTEEEADAFEHSNIILQALGTTEDVEVDITFHTLRKGDRLLLCSDGLSGLVHREVMRSILMNEKDPSQCTKKLIEMANNAGGHDNITVVIVDFEGDGLEEPSEEDSVQYRQYQKLAPQGGLISQRPIDAEELNAMIFSMEQGTLMDDQEDGDLEPGSEGTNHQDFHPNAVHSTLSQNDKHQRQWRNMKMTVLVASIVLWLVYLFITRN